MPRIFDNIDKKLLPALQETMQVAERADFCVGYFNLRGWRHLSDYIEKWSGGEKSCCRLLVGMHISPSDELKSALRQDLGDSVLDNQTALREKKKIAEEFRRQLTFGIPTASDEHSLRTLAAQIKAGKVVIRVFLAYPLHAKLYLLHRKDANNPTTGFLGSSNLTLAGLAAQGELNVDVLEHDACAKLAAWFDDRWHDRWSVDISKELAEIIDLSWAGERLVPPYHVYLKVAYHLAQEARAGLSEFQIPIAFKNTLFDFQVAAVKIAAHHLNKRGGVLIGDVVGLGKSLMATALAKVFEEDYHTETLIICPKNLCSMWEDYCHRYQLHAKVLPLSRVIGELPEKTRRFRVVLIDESHNLRNRDGKRWRTIRDYIERNDSLVILLSATPYNKTYLDLSSQLALFLREDTDLGIRPESHVAEIGGEHEFIRRYQCPVRSLAAFEKSASPDDWRELMRLYMVRRTRGFIVQNYSSEDSKGRYLRFSDGRTSYFPKRVPRNLTYTIDESSEADPYAKLFSDRVVDAVNSLTLPRYGLGNYVVTKWAAAPSPAQTRTLDALSRAGARLKGFCRTNLFKRLESAGPAFLLSIERHILRNFVTLHALENGSEVPIGAQDAEVLDTRLEDEDPDGLLASTDEDEDMEAGAANGPAAWLRTEAQFRDRASRVYAGYSSALQSRFRWLPSSFFKKSLATDLLRDSRSLLEVLQFCGDWHAENDTKLNELLAVVRQRHKDEKVLVFTQFADTAHYLAAQLEALGVPAAAAATGRSADPTALAWRFSPVSNAKDVKRPEELRILIATDVLSEGQNLQDAHIIVNYDLPWAIIRLIQRAGRVDRIGQQSDTITCYSFVPADGIERVIRLRARVRQRLQENAEVVGSDEQFFDDEINEQRMRDLYTEKSGILDDDGDVEVDLASYAYQIWKNAIDVDPSLAGKIESMPDVVYATKAHDDGNKGLLLYMRSAQGNDALAWVDRSGRPVTQSHLAILRAAACSPQTPALPRAEDHHELTEKAFRHLVEEERSFGGALGRPSGARFKTYERIKRFRETMQGKLDLFITEEYLRRVDRVLDEIYRYPMYQSATDTLNRQLKSGIGDLQLVDVVLSLREDGRLCILDEGAGEHEPHLICTMGLV